MSILNRRPWLNASRREALTFYLLISPWLIGFLVFVLGPMLASLYFSFTEWNLLKPPVWIGARNYVRMANDPLIAQAFKVTGLFTLVYVPLELIGGLGLALLLNQKVRGLRGFRTMFYLPSVVSGVAYVVLWMWIFHPRAGLLNTILGFIGIEGPTWLASPDWALPAIVIMSLWGLGRTMVIYLAGLQGIPQQLYESAALDGANSWRQFWAITLPLLTPTIFFNLVLSIIATSQTFTQAFVATNGGPLDSTLFYVLYLYRQAFQNFRMGYASAMAWVLFVVVLSLTLIVIRSARSWVYYENDQGAA
jgi:multiple sugar transport system permease protein